MFKTVIIDDESDARDFTETIIQDLFPEIKILAKVSSVIEGINAILKNKPDLVFLDIEMQDGTGFDVLDAIPDRDFDVIFVTAYNQYALKAFKYSAINYIVKPIEIDEFKTVVSKLIKNKLMITLNQQNYEILKENIKSQIPSNLVLQSMQGIDYIKTSDIIRFEADDRYTHVILSSKRKITISKTLGEFNFLIDNSVFYRSHKSHIISLQHVKTYVKKDGGYILMDDDSEVAIARNKKDEFIKIMSNLSI